MRIIVKTQAFTDLCHASLVARMEGVVEMLLNQGRNEIVSITVSRSDWDAKFYGTIFYKQEASKPEGY